MPHMAHLTTARMSPPTSPISPTRMPRRTAPRGFLPSQRQKTRPINQMSVRELRETYERNVRILSQPAASTSTYVQRISHEQAAIEARLVELVGVDQIQKMLHKTSIKDDNDMTVDHQEEQTQPRPIDAKRRALANFSTKMPRADSNSNNSIFTYQEAMQLEQEANALARKRERELAAKVEDRRRRMGLSIAGEGPISAEEKNARMWAFLNYKPTDSDPDDEDDEDDESDENDPSTWFDDDQDDGRKGQDIVEPDFEDLSSIIRIDETRIPQNPVWDPHE